MISLSCETLWSRFASAKAGVAVLDFDKEPFDRDQAVPDFTAFHIGDKRFSNAFPAVVESRFIRDVFSDDYSNQMVAQSLKFGELLTECPFSRMPMTCVGSHYERGRNYLFFHGDDEVCVLVQNHSQVIGAAFLRRQIILGRTRSALPADRLQKFLGRYLSRIEGFAAALHPPRFRGAIASYWRPNHYFYDVLPSVHALADALGDQCGSLPLASMGDGAFIDLQDHFSGRFPVLPVADAEALNAHNQHEAGFMVAVGARTKEDPLAADRVDADIVERCIIQARNGPMADQLREAESHPMTLWVGLCAEKRGWEGQEEGIASVAEQLQASRGSVALIADGMTRTVGQDRTAFRQAACGAEIAVLERIKDRLPGVRIFDLIGAGSAEKIAFGSACGLFLAGGMTDSMWPAKLGARPGVAHTSTVADISSQSHPRTRHFPKSKVRDLPGREKSNFTLVSYRIKPETMSRFVRREILPLMPGLLSSPAVRVLSGPRAAVRQSPGRILVDLGMEDTLELEALEGATGGVLKCPVGAGGACRVALRGLMDPGVRVRVGLASNDCAHEPPVTWSEAEEGVEIRAPQGAETAMLRLQISGQGRASIHEAFLIPVSGSS